MTFWEQFALMQASAAINVVLVRYASKYLKPEERQAAMVLSAALAELPERIHSGGFSAAIEPPDPQMFLQQTGKKK